MSFGYCIDLLCTETVGDDDAREQMLNKFMNAKHPNGSTYSQTDVLFTATSVVAAGSDTTAVATASLFAFLTGNPEVYAKLQKEVSRISGL